MNIHMATFIVLHISPSGCVWAGFKGESHIGRSLGKR